MTSTFSPAALVAYVGERRVLIGEVAGHFGFARSQSLVAVLANLRRDDPDYPLRRRRLRGRVYIEPAGPGGEATRECPGCFTRRPLSAFARTRAGGRRARCQVCQSDPVKSD